MKIYFKSPAKINLFLEIKNKRSDGYHNLESIMQTINLCDTIFFELIDKDILIECNDKSINNKKNIIYKTVLLIKNYFNIKSGVKIYLKKNIPISSGLGGGSSNAATTIKALVKLWNIKTTKSKLNQIAKEIGADVPFFLTCGTALCRGIGEIVIPLNDFLIHDLNIVLVNPGFGLSTKNIYKRIKYPLKNQKKINKTLTYLFKGYFSYCFNRLEEFVIPYYPEIKKIKNVLNELGYVNLMSGSGSTVFGILNSNLENQRIKNDLEKYKWQIWFTSTVNI
ncbi:MAG: 4-(cytidine 5'-diphospho)-2-C-methyl-D-erythritol kinase [Endomicrobium sp.]|jgi:4-diphosphocytidyl-2-C-methyl-D-erythritol kinase|nr:4-(cytidine 5'-diphospho)-2-C-methyl-D-erythritol kinase [Endomicrobium sp.]